MLACLGGRSLSTRAFGGAIILPTPVAVQLKPAQRQASSSYRHLYDNHHLLSDDHGKSQREQRHHGLILGRHVKEALANGCPIVALESTVITHGLPEPQNLKLALQLENEIASGHWWLEPSEASDADSQDDAKLKRWTISQNHMTITGDVKSIGRNSNKQLQDHERDIDEHNLVLATYSGTVVPATIGIVKGQLVVGLSRDEIEFLATSQRSRPIKASRRDIPIAMAMKLSAGTTVSATMAIASSLPDYYSDESTRRLGGACESTRGVHDGSTTSSRRVGLKGSGSAIKVFATGGMGGVHLGGELSMDISADLYEFARSPIGVVSAGFKSFLDTRRSLEFLETMGCTVTSLAAFESTYQAAKLASLSSVGSAVYLSKKKRAESENHAHHHQRHHHHYEDARGRQTDAGHHFFPGFFSAINKERVKSPWQCASVREAAEILYQCLEAPVFCQDQRRAMLLACPIPNKFSMSLEDDQAYKCAMANVSSIDKRLDLSGNEKTPLILDQLNRATGGKTLEANVELLRNNARVGAHLAHEYAILGARTGAILPDGHDHDDNQDHHHKLRQHAGLDASGDKANEPRTGGAPRHQIGPDSGSNSKKPKCNGLAKRQGHNLDALHDEISAKNGKRLAHTVPRPPVVVGCTMIDMHVSTKIDHHFKTNPNHSGVTFLGKPHMTLGGVGRNMATALELLGHQPIFVTSLAKDNLGEFALGELEKCGLSLATNRLKINWFKSDASKQANNNESTCFALVLMDSISGQCEFVIANLEANLANNKQQIQASGDLLDNIRNAPLVMLDANLIDETIEFLVEFCSHEQVPIFLEPTDVVCMPQLVTCLNKIKLQKPNTLNSLAFLSPNIIELSEMLQLFDEQQQQGNSASSGNNIPRRRIDPGRVTVGQVEKMALTLLEQYLPQLKCLLVTMDRRGLLVALRTGQDNIEQIKLIDELADGSCLKQIRMKHFVTPKLVENPVSASGAGDSFASGFVSGLLDSLTLIECTQRGFKASYLALLDRDTISVRLKELSSHSNDQ